MNFFIVDDDQSIRAMLIDMIEEENLGIVVGEASDGSQVESELLKRLRVDILLIDLLMPERDGIETIHHLSPFFKGKSVMISQVEAKNMIGEAYALGVEYYITKPLNRLEVTSVLKRISEKILLETSIHEIHKSLSLLNQQNQEPYPYTQAPIPSDITTHGKSLLIELGIQGESGYKDLLEILEVMHDYECSGGTEFPSLKELFIRICQRNNKGLLPYSDLKREVKSSEQRVRRAIHQSLEHIASLGLTDFTNPKFEEYSSKYFDYSQVRLKMLELQNQSKENLEHARVNIKKFIQILYIEARDNMNHY